MRSHKTNKGYSIVYYNKRTERKRKAERKEMDFIFVSMCVCRLEGSGGPKIITWT